MTLSEQEQREWSAIVQAIQLDEPVKRNQAVPRRGRLARAMGWVLLSIAVLMLVTGLAVLVLSVLGHDPSIAITGH